MNQNNPYHCSQRPHPPNCPNLNQNSLSLLPIDNWDSFHRIVLIWPSRRCFTLLSGVRSTPLEDLSNLQSTSYSLPHHSWLLGQGALGCWTPLKLWGVWQVSQTKFYILIKAMWPRSQPLVLASNSYVACCHSCRASLRVSTDKILAVLDGLKISLIDILSKVHFIVWILEFALAFMVSNLVHEITCGKGENHRSDQQGDGWWPQGVGVALPWWSILMGQYSWCLIHRVCIPLR